MKRNAYMTGEYVRPELVYGPEWKVDKEGVYRATHKYMDRIASLEIHPPRKGISIGSTKTRCRSRDENNVVVLDYFGYIGENHPVEKTQSNLYRQWERHIARESR